MQRKVLDAIKEKNAQPSAETKPVEDKTKQQVAHEQEPDENPDVNIDVDEEEEEERGEGNSYDFQDEESVRGAGEDKEQQLEQEVTKLMEERKFAEAYDTLKSLEIINESNPKTYVNMAKCQKELGLFIQAVKSLQLAVNLDPSYACSNSSKKHYKDNEIILMNSNDI